MLMDRSFIELFLIGKGYFPSGDGECGIGGQKVHPIYNELFLVLSLATLFMPYLVPF